MSARENRRVLVFAILVAIGVALAAFWYHGFGVRTPEERAREQAEQLREKVRDMTHGESAPPRR